MFGHREFQELTNLNTADELVSSGSLASSNTSFVMLPNLQSAQIPLLAPSVGDLHIAKLPKLLVLALF